MKVIITGGAGFLGQRLAAEIARKGVLPGPGGDAYPVRELVLFDMTDPVPPAGGELDVRSVAGDINDPASLEAVVRGADVVFHLAAVVSAAAEADFELGMRVNLDGTRAVLEACRRQRDGSTRLVFASSVAVFGGELPPVIRDDTAPMPQSSYGSQKAVGELLVNDYARRGLVDGRTVRLPTIVVRPGRPNRAASSFASSIVREPLQGEDAVCPVPAETPVYVLSPRRVTESLLRAAMLPGQDFGPWRTVMLPGIRVTVAGMLDALKRAGGEAAVARVRFEPDPRIRAIVESWPADFDTARADRLGFRADSDFDAIVRAFVEDDLDRPSGTQPRMNPEKHG